MNMNPETQILNKCKSVIQQLQQELSLALKRNQEQEGLIKILTNQRQYYVKKNQNEQMQYLNLNTQLSKNKHLIQSLKTQNYSLNQQLAHLNHQLQQRNFLLEAQDQQIKRIKEEKAILQKQWSRVVNSVKGKLYSLHSNNITINQKQTLDKKYDGKVKQKNIDDKVYQIMKQINMRIAEDQIQSLIQIKKQNIYFEEEIEQEEKID